MTFEKLLEGITFNTISLKGAYDFIMNEDSLKSIAYFLNRDKISKDPMTDADLNKLKALVEVLQILYNSPIGSPVPDDHYDILQEILVNLGIPRLTGSVEINSSSKLNHNYTSLRGTLSKIYYLRPDEKRTNKSRKYLHEWIKSTELLYKRKTGKDINLSDTKVMLTPKFDGVSCVLEAGDKMIWLTRGNTRTNEASDVSNIMNIFNDLYLEYKGHGIKFEVMMTEENKDKINELYKNRQYKNSRQIVTAILNSNDPDFKADYLYPVPLRIMKAGDNVEEIHPDLIKKFPTHICKLSDVDDIKKFSRENKWIYVNGMRFRTDGVVITILDPKIQQVLGRDNDINNFEVAYKFTEEYAYTKVRDIEFYVSEFGYITPVLVVSDVILKGNTINHISLSNKERFDELDLAYGDTVKVLYDIIPYATMDENCTRVKNGRRIPFVPRCPKCREDLDLTTVEVQCKNPDCPSRKIGRILNYCNNLRIQNIGYQTLESLEYAGLLDKGIRSLYKLKKKSLEIEELEGFGRLKTKKIIAEIESKRRLRDYDFFGSLGIETLSIKTFRMIFSEIPYNEFINMIKVKNFDLMMAKLLQINGIGESKANILIGYLKDVNNRKELEKLLKEVYIQQTFGESKQTRGRVVFTGCRPSEELEVFLKEHGWDSSDSWSSKAKYLIVPNDSYESNKVYKARDLGIPIISLSSQDITKILK